jgi:hypothetical protein
MANAINPHVSQLNDFLPLDAGSSALFQEYVDPNDHPSIPTRALAYLREQLASQDRELRLIVLTGDAGHGKTHLCSKLLEGLGFSPDEAKVALTTRCDGTDDLAELPAGRPLRIVKDLSDMTVSRGAQALADALAPGDALTIVCANEGRLRSALSEKRDLLDPVAICLDQGLSEGRLDVEPRVIVLNLNFQSVAAPENPIAVGLLRWAIDGRRWRSCASCDARPACPINENQRLLADGTQGKARVEALELLFQTAERIGAVITVRELLMFTAYVITGGIRCTDVHAKANRTDWQFDYEFSQNVFGDRLKPSERSSLRSLRHIRLIDPGAVSIRAVDDDVAPTQDDAGGRFLPREALIDGSAATTRAQAKNAAEATRSLFRFMRRRDFFSPRIDSEKPLQPLGFTFGTEFVAGVRGDLAASAFRRLRDQLIAGLEAVQGLRRSGSRRHLLLVDPAFGAGSTATSIVARRISITDIEVRSQSDSWRRQLGREADLPRAVDWSDRAIVIELLDDGKVYPLYVDLLTFEYLMRAGEGLDGRSFFDAEVRRMAGALAPLVQGVDDDQQIEIVRDGRLEGLVIDTGDVIRKVTD